MNFVLIFLGGGMGAVARYTLKGVVYRFTGSGFAYGTLVVNVLGCLLIGLVMTSMEERLPAAPSLRAFFTIGLLGGFTTFSSFSDETMVLLREGDLLRGAVSVIAGVLSCLCATWLGMVLGPLRLGYRDVHQIMNLEGEGKLLRIFLGEPDRVDGRMLYEVIVRTAREAGPAGASVRRGIEGFGANSRIHTASILRLSEDLPIVVEIIDTEEKLRAFLPVLDALFRRSGSDGPVTLQNADIIHYRTRDTAER